MFQAREPQESLWQSEFLITPRKARLMRRSWAEVFRNEALVLIKEERFAPMYSPDMGRPNRAVQTVLGVLVTCVESRRCLPVPSPRASIIRSVVSQKANRPPSCSINRTRKLCSVFWARCASSISSPQRVVPQQVELQLFHGLHVRQIEHLLEHE